MPLRLSHTPISVAMLAGLILWLWPVTDAAAQCCGGGARPGEGTGGRPPTTSRPPTRPPLPPRPNIRDITRQGQLPPGSGGTGGTVKRNTIGQSGMTASELRDWVDAQIQKYTASFGSDFPNTKWTHLTVQDARNRPLIREAYVSYQTASLLGGLSTSHERFLQRLDGGKTGLYVSKDPTRKRRTVEYSPGGSKHPPGTLVTTLYENGKPTGYSIITGKDGQVIGVLAGRNPIPHSQSYVEANNLINTGKPKHTRKTIKQPVPIR